MMVPRLSWSVVCAALLAAACGGRARQEAPAGAAPTARPTARPVGDAPPAAIALPRPDSASAPVRRPTAPTRPTGLVLDAEVDSAVASRRARLALAGDGVAEREIGYYVDVQEARLRQIGGTSLQVLRDGQTLTLRLAARYAFEVGSAQLSDSARAMVSQVARVLGDYRSSVVSVFGHTDDSGDAAGNQRLSEQRALAVMRQLVDGGVASNRVLAVGLGSRRPLGENSTPAGREANRRVELRIEVVR